MNKPLWMILALLAAGYRRVTRPKVVEDAIARDGLTPEQLEEYYRSGGGVARPDAPDIDEGGI